MPKVFQYNDGDTALPVITVSCANGFTPELYMRALQPLFPSHRVVALNMRPLWGDASPRSLTNWRQLGDDLLETLDTVTQQPVIGVGHSVGGIATIYARDQAACSLQPSRVDRTHFLDAAPVVGDPAISSVRAGLSDALRAGGLAAATCVGEQRCGL